MIGERTAPAETTVAAGEPLLDVRRLAKHFGGVKAVDDASFAVPQGSITALIGPNGSGKTTAFNLIDGTMTPSAGEVWFDGRRIDKLPPYRRAHLGLGRTFQITRLFREMTVLENVVAPLRTFSWGQLNASAMRGDEVARAEELLTFVGMERFRDQKAGALSYGQQKLVELAQVLMLDPKLILLDEPAGGINPTLIERMGEMIRTLNRQGTTFLIVEHNMPFVLGLCDPVLVLARGTCICEGAPDARAEGPAVLDAYLGEDFVLERRWRDDAAADRARDRRLRRRRRPAGRRHRAAVGRGRLHRRAQRRRQVDGAARDQRAAAPARGTDPCSRGRTSRAATRPRSSASASPRYRSPTGCSRTSACARTC